MSAVDYSLQIDEVRETAICEVRGLSKSYRNFWLNDVSFKLEPGYIMGFMKKGSKNHELLQLANSFVDFSEADIDERTQRIFTSFVDFLSQNMLLE